MNPIINIIVNHAKWIQISRLNGDIRTYPYTWKNFQYLYVCIPEWFYPYQINDNTYQWVRHD